MPKFSIPICDTWIDIAADDEDHALEKLADMSVRDLMSWIDLGIGTPTITAEVVRIVTPLEKRQ
jgi:hypothetical protein